MFLEPCLLNVSFRSFLGEILPHILTKSSAIDEVLDEHNLLAFPISEELWEVKEPVVVATYSQHCM